MTRHHKLFFGIALAAAIGMASSGARAEECTVGQQVSLPMAGGFGGLVVIQAAINDTNRLFLVNTGRGVSSVTQRVVDELRLAPMDLSTRKQIYDFRGNRFRQYVTLSSVNLAGAVGTNLDFLVEPDDSAIDTRIAGSLAKNILGNFDVEFDFAARRLNLLSPKHCAGRVVYWSNTYADAAFKLDKNGNILVPMMLDGKRIEAMLDTASPSTRLDLAVARKLFGLKEDSPGVETIPDAAPDSPVQYRYRFKSLSVEGISVVNPMIDLFDNAMRKGFFKENSDKVSMDPVYGAGNLKTADLILGLNVLSKLHLYVAYGEQKIYVTEAGAH